MKGILESIPEFMQVAVAIAIGIVLIVLTFEFFQNMQHSTTVEVSGDKLSMAKSVSQLVLSCWKDHRYGLDPQSDICKIVRVKSNTGFSESDMINFLDCSVIPDNTCSPDDCSKCTSEKYSDQDKIKWDVSSFPSNISISYSGDERAIIIAALT